MGKIIDKIKNIEDDFFVVDKESKKATVSLRFARATDIFEKNYVTKKPVLSDEFFNWIKKVFAVIPKKYRIDIDVRFDDMCGFDEAELKELFIENVILEAKKLFSGQRSRRFTAYGLIAVGTVLLTGMILVNALWREESIIKSIFSYVSDIATTVTYWEAMNILLIEQNENTGYAKALIKRFDNIDFKKA